jgi:hypothetical protein
VSERSDDDNDLRATYGPDEVPPADVAPDPESETASDTAPEAEVEGPADQPVPDPTATEPVVTWDEAADAAFTQPFVAPPDAAPPAEEPPPPGPRRNWAAAAFAGALIALFFLPWFNAGGLLSSSGAAMVAWTDRFLAELPRRQFHGSMLVPYAAVLILAGALAVVVQALRRRPVRLLAVGTALVAPLLLAYAVAREGSSVFKVLDVGAYLTLVASLGLLVVALLGTWTRAARGFLLGGLTVLVIAAFVIPQVAQDDVDSQYFAAFAKGETSLAEPTPRSKPADSGTSTAAATTTTTVAEVALPAETSTTEAPGSTTTTAAQRGASGGCPSNRPSAEVTRFTYEQQSAESTTYVVDVEGRVLNRTSAAVDVSSISFVVVRGSSQVASDRVDAGRTVAANGSLNWWSRGFIVESPDGPPTEAQVTGLVYAWNDPSLSSCAR